MNRLTKLICGHTGKKDRNKDIKDGVAHQIKKEEIYEGLWPFIPELLQPQILGLFRHGDHKLAFSVMFHEKCNRSVYFPIKG